MAKKISKADISDSDVFGALRESAEKALVDVSALNAELVEIAEETAKKLKDVKFDSAKSINEFAKATKEANIAQKEAVKLDGEEAKLKQQLIKITQEEEKLKQQETKTERDLLRTAQANNREKQKVINASLKAKKAADDENNAYKKLVKATRDQKNESKKLAAELLHLEASNKKGTKEWRNLTAQYKKVTKAAQKGDVALKKIDSTVGDNFRNVGNYKNALGGLKAGLGQLGLAFGGIQLIKGAGETVMEFGQSVADLKAITGASGDDLDFFKERAIETGTKIEGGAASVIEAYKLIASAKPELLENAEALDAVTQSAITLAQASGLELPDAATRLTDAMNQFGAPAEQAGKFIDVLANGAKFGAAEIPQITDALIKFGAASRSSNVSIEESTALIEVLAENGKKGAEAGTAIRNVMLKLSSPDVLPKKAQDALRELGVSFEDLEDPSKSFAERLELLKPALEQSGSLTEIFGIENQIAAQNLIENTDRIGELTVKMNENGTAQEQANERTSTLAGAFTELKNTFNNWIISLNEGAGAGEFLKNMLLGIARNFDKILFAIKVAIKGFVAYKAMLILVAARQKVLSLNFKRIIPQILIFGRNLKKSTRGTLGLSNGLKGATGSVKGMGRALKTIPFIAIIGLVVELAGAIWDLVTAHNAEAQAAADRAEQAANIEKAKTKGAKEGSEEALKIAEKIAAKRKEIDEDVADGKIKNETAANKIFKKFIEEEARLIQNTNDAYDEQIGNHLDTQQRMINQIPGLEKAAKKAEKRAASSRVADIGRDQVEKNRNAAFLARRRVDVSIIQRDKAEASIFKLMATQEKLVEQEGELFDQADDVRITIKQTNKERTHQAARVKEVNAEFTDQIQLVKELNKLREDNLKIEEDIAELDLKDDLRAQNNLLDEQIKKRQKEADKGGNVYTDESAVAGFLGLTEIEEIKNTIAKKLELEIAFEKEKERLEIESAKSAHDERFKNLQIALEKEKKEKLAQAGITPKQEAKIIEGFDREQRDLDDLKIEEKKRLDNEILVIERSTQNDIIEIKEESAEKQDGIVKDLNERSKEANALSVEEAKKQEDKLIAEETAAAERRIELARAVTDAFIAASNEKIAQYDKEIAKATEQLDFLKSAAAQGNIDAKESLAEQQRLIDEANRKKQKEEQKQAKIKLALSAYSAYERNASDPSVQNPLGKTITDITLLKAFISALPAFLEGTENTGSNGMGIDGKGGFQAILHPNERVLTKDQNNKVGNLSNPELANIAMEYQQGKLIRKGEGAVQIGGSWQTSKIVEKLTSLEQTIQNKPEHNLAVEDIVTGAMTIARSTRNGSTTTYNRYRVKP
tara:strand:- start:5651 stop:9649 length:3999 start_codon:yes stop_codon:yes gene_type:complete